MGILGVLVIAAIWILLRKDKLVIKADKIVHVHKFMLFSRKHDEIGKKEITSGTKWFFGYEPVIRKEKRTKLKNSCVFYEKGLQ